MNSPAASLPFPFPFTAAERELIRCEMGLHFGQYPSLADGLVKFRAERTASLLY